MTKNGKAPSYVARFVGYSADIFKLDRRGNTWYATIDFVGGFCQLYADDGAVMVPRRSELAQFVASLPLYADRLREIVASGGTKLECGENLISMSPTTNIARFIRQINDRHARIRQMLVPVEKVGYEIERRPYKDHLEEFDRTGLCRVISYGIGVFVDGRLWFRPEHHTALMRPLEGPEGTDFEVVYDSESGTGGSVH